VKSKIAGALFVVLPTKRKSRSGEREEGREKKIASNREI